MQATFSFGQSERERLEVQVLGYERPPTGEYHDDNWLRVEIRIHAGGFQGQANAAIVTDELTHFLEELRPLQATLRGTAEFTTLEEQLHLELTGDGRGHIELKGEMADQAGIGNRLHFHLEFDQSQLRFSILDLEHVVKNFPIRA